MKRREFLKKAAVVAATATAATEMTGCAQKDSFELLKKIPNITPEQAARKRKERSQVALIPAASYEDDLLARLKEYAQQVSIPSLKNKRVVLKPNMVEFRGDGKPITTNPAVLRAAIQFVDYLGAREIIVAEGPGHMRDTEYLLDKTGIGKACRDLKVPFVDLNLDDIEKVPNTHGFNGLKEFYLPKTIIGADAVVSVPKMKTHHWVGVTCSMKNLFGVVPGRKYGWPKNLLHIKGIPRSIIDLVHLVNPTFAVVDAIVAMEGDGPINGTAIDTGFLVLGCDVAAVDATCIRAMSMDPNEFAYVILAGKVVGNIDEEMIDVVGGTLAELKRPFKQPLTMKNKSLLAGAAHEGS
jgi:uncharacterized protein (DUF362 family)